MEARAAHRGVAWWLLLVTLVAVAIGMLLLVQSGPHVVDYWRQLLPFPAALSTHAKPSPHTSSPAAPSLLDYVGVASSAVTLLGAVSSGTRFVLGLIRRQPR